MAVGVARNGSGGKCHANEREFRSPAERRDAIPLRHGFREISLSEKRRAALANRPTYYSGRRT